MIDCLVVGFSEDGKARCKGCNSNGYVSGDGSFEPLCRFVKFGGVVSNLD